MPIFNFTATKSYYICNIDGQSITINNSDQIAFDMDTLSMPEVRSLAIGVYYNELETNDNDSFTAYYTGLLGDISNPNFSGGLTESQVNTLIDTKLEDFTPSSSGGGFVFGGDWDATPIDTGEIAPIFNFDYPNDLTKTYRVSAANAHSVVNGKLLKVNDFVDFITNEDDEVVDVVVSRLVSDSNIRDTISTALNDPNSSLSSLVMNLGGVDAVVSSLDEAINDNPSDLTTSLDNFLAYQLVNNASLFYEAFQTLVQDAVYAYIQNAVQVNGDIYTAIEQYVSDSTTGVNGHAAIQTAIEENLNNYADGIGVGANGQLYPDVMEAALAAISNEIQSGGIIDTAIQTAINP